MKMSRLRELQQAEPFRPYTLVMADGRQLRVKHPEFVLLHPDKRTVVLVEESHRTHILDVRMATDAILDVMSDPRMNPEAAAA